MYKITEEIQLERIEALLRYINDNTKTLERIEKILAQLLELAQFNVIPVPIVGNEND